MSAETAAVAAPRPAARLATSWHRPALAAVLALTVFLDLFRLSQNGWANAYYSGAVRSMLRSWHNFFYVAFDPGGLVSVDKPPLALWLQAASAKLFGYSGFAILLPEALCGVGAVALLYLLVARYFGRVAGLVAALALALTPVFVAVSRDNNPDALFILLLVAAAYAGARAIESGRVRTLALAAALVGLAFNTKMLAAAIVVPGLAAGYLLFAPGALRRRIVHCAAALGVLVAVSGAWLAAVELTPAASRPYVGSTSTDNVLSLVLGYNGFGRVLGQSGGTSTAGGGIGGVFSGMPGLFRLVNSALGDQAGWLLPLAIVGGVSLVLATRRRRELGALAVIGGWFAVAAAVLSYSSGIVHTYYVSSLAPATAALVGAGSVALWRDARRGGRRASLPLVALALTGWLELVILRRSGYDTWLEAVVAVGSVGALAVTAGLAEREAFDDHLRRRAASAATGAALVALLAAPAAWSATVLSTAVNGVFPGAGPSFASARGFGPAGVGGPGGATSSSEVAAALEYAKSHGAARVALVVQNDEEAAPYVIDGQSIASMGGFTGRETVVSRATLARLVSSGDARYFLLGPGGYTGLVRSNAGVETITSTCRAVSTSAWVGSAATSNTLYDCAGQAAAIADGG